MIVLKHYEKQSLEKFLNRLSDLNALYIERSFSLDTELIKLLNDAEKFYEQIGKPIKKSEVSALDVYIQTATRGFDPQTLEKLKLGKRNNIWISSFHVLSELGNLLRDSLHDIETQINEASILLEQLILSAIQSNTLNDDTLQKVKDSQQIKALWEQLTQNEQIKLIERKLRLFLVQEDIFILLDKIFNKIGS